MIFTECPHCDEPQVFGHEAGDKTGFFPSRCPKCKKVMWVEATCIGGVTRSHESFKEEIMRPGDKKEIEEAATAATNQSHVVYDT